MNIIIGKLGKSLLFDKTKWGAIGGDGDAVLLFTNMIHRHPEHTFYLLGKSDYSRLDPDTQMELNKHNNVIDIWDDFVAEAESRDTAIRHIINKYDSLPKMDCGLFVSGPVGSSNVIGHTRKITNPEEFTSPLYSLANYAGPQIWYLNESKVPYVMVHNDPRYTRNKAYDFMHHAEIVFSQLNESVEFKHCTDYSSQESVKVKQDHRYAPVATASLIGRKDEELTTSSIMSLFGETKRDKFIIVLNEGGGQIKPRYPILKDSVLNHVDDVEVYGKWTTEAAQYEVDPRFKGPLPFWSLQRKLKEAKYTYCIPIKPDWSTLKFWECAHAGIIPFMHKTYDTQENIKCNGFLRVDSSKQLLQRIQYLEDNPHHYEKLLAHLKRDVLTESIYDGSELDNILMNALEEIA